MSSCSLVHSTPSLESHLAAIARVSNPSNQANQSISGLIGYMLREGHWSPFEMVNICIEVNCPRDIGRQLLRHWTLRPQEFSQRYSSVSELPGVTLREARMADPTNRQGSLPCTDPDLASWWAEAQSRLFTETKIVYEMALAFGLAKECARAVLMEGLTPTRLYFNGNLRSWLHFCSLRMGHGTQKETQAIAEECWLILCGVAPVTTEAWAKHKEKSDII